MTSPASLAPEMDASQSSGNPFVDIPTRPMRVKVLYTFDNDNKTNCLARFPDVLHIPTVPIDETTQIGVMELRTCIRAIVSASPELISRLGQGDFTIYAYDYSEYETPLVGQGMLSSVLAAQSPTPTAPAYQSKTMITGRVCKNIMGLFSNGVKETLEVKLRLVPVPKPVQNDFIKNMELYRSISPAMSAGFDPNAWSASLHQSAIALGAPFQDSLTPGGSFQDSLTPTQSMQDMSGHDMVPFQRSRQGSNASFNGQHVTYSAPPTRVNSPALNPLGPQPYPLDNIRPSSSMSVRSDVQNGLREPFTASESYQDEGPARKRVKVTQADWRGKSAFGMNPDSLRVTASTAASIRVHKPVPTRPGMLINSLEPPPRAPTPVPQMALPGGRSNPAGFLRRESSLARAQTYTSPYNQPTTMPPPSDAASSCSPEDANEDPVGITPTDFPSSPPILPEPSSPGLPSFPRPADSGYMSSAFECHDDDEDRSVDEEDMQMAAQYRPRAQVPHSDMSFIEQTPGPPELLPTKMQMAQQANNGIDHAAQAEMSRQKARNAVLAQNTRRNSLALPPKSQSQNGNKPTMARSASMIVRSDAASPAPSEAFSAMRGPRSGSGAKRKKNIQEQLQRSIENGEMPTFCGHCGAIETPTWRHLFTKVMEGSPEDMNPAESESITMGTEVLERNPETQKATKYRIIKSMRKTKDSMENSQGFDILQVCNPCGLWFNKFKVMRPPEKWVKKQKKQQRKAMPPAGPSEPQSDYFVDQPSALYTDAVQPDEDSNRSSRERSGEAAAQPANRPRANSAQPQPSRDEKQSQWTGAQLDAALHRAIQSSPARFLGTQESPIEVETELTPRPTRRLLFPSPRQDGEVKTLDDMALPGSKPTSSTIIEMAFVEEEPDKENRPPENYVDDLAHLFECSPNVFKTPRKTPTKNGSPVLDSLLKTPTPSRSSLRTVARNTRTPSGNQASTFLPTFSSAEAKNLFPMTPSRWANLSSPSRNQLTPFTRQLTQLLSDANYNEFSDLPTFMTPGRNLDFGFDDFGMLNVDMGLAANGEDNNEGDQPAVNTAVMDAATALHATTSADAAAQHPETAS